MATKSKKKTKVTEKVEKTEFSLSAPQAQSVSIAGDFNQWNPSSHPLVVHLAFLCWIFPVSPPIQSLRRSITVGPLTVSLVSAVTFESMLVTLAL
jgi:hypothetical protein